jgi:hypothetical protein
MLAAMSSPDRKGAPMPGASIDEIVLSDEPERWSALGFSVLGENCQIGRVRLRLAGRDGGRGILGWSLRAISSVELDGLPTCVSERTLPKQAPEHPNGVGTIDHVVALSPALERTVAALQAAGLDLRRVREQPTPAGAPRQAFFRLGAEILEVVQEPEAAVQRGGGPDRPARLWGLALTVADLDATVAALAPHAGSVRPAVQPGRRIATVRRSAGLALPVALMSSAAAR